MIRVQNLCKEYLLARSLGDVLRHPWAGPRRIAALHEVSFEVSAGRIAAVVGLNGAGKTTLLKILCNLLLPSSGEVCVAGHPLDSEARAARSKIGFVPSDERSFFWRISARANLEFFAALYGMPPRGARRRIDELLHTFGLANKSGGHFRDYSSGMRKRLAVIRGLLHEPQVLVLDEPTNSLDAHWDHVLREYVRRWARGGPRRAVVWSTHRMDEVDSLCDQVLWLQEGRLVSQSSTPEPTEPVMAGTEVWA
jgi:ABC-2 type transport system ATP-binding protein